MEGLRGSPFVYTQQMKKSYELILIVISLFVLAACGTPSDPVFNDGVADASPVGTNLKNKSGYKRGGSSSSVKILTREQMDEEGVTADDILHPD